MIYITSGLQNFTQINVSAGSHVSIEDMKYCVRPLPPSIWYKSSVQTRIIYMNWRAVIRELFGYYLTWVSAVSPHNKTDSLSFVYFLGNRWRGGIVGKQDVLRLFPIGRISAKWWLQRCWSPKDTQYSVLVCDIKLETFPSGKLVLGKDVR